MQAALRLVVERPAPPRTPEPQLKRRRRALGAHTPKSSPNPRVSRASRSPPDSAKLLHPAKTLRVARDSSTTLLTVD